MANSFESDDFEVGGEALYDASVPAEVDPDTWYAAERRAADLDGSSDGRTNVWGVLKAARFAPHAKHKEAVEAMPSEFADIALAMLRSGDSIAERALAARTLKKELSKDEVFTMLRTEARALRREFAASAAEGAPVEAMDSEVYTFVSRSWLRMVKARTRRQRARTLRHIAELFGGLLAQVPEMAIRRAFERVLMSWSTGHQAPRAVTGQQRRDADRASSSGTDGDATGDERAATASARRTMQRLGQQLSANEAGIGAAPLTPLAIAESLAAVAAADPEVLEQYFEVFSRCVVLLGPAQIGATDLWDRLADAAPVLRVWLLHALITNNPGGLEVLEESGIGGSAALQVCTDFAFEEREDLPKLPDDGAGQPKRPRTRRAFNKKKRRKGEWWGPKAANVDGKPVLRRVPQRPVEELLVAFQGEEEAQTKAGRILEHLATAGGLADLGETDALALFRCLGKRLGAAAPQVLRPLLQGARSGPAKFSEAELLPVACSLPTTIGAQLWASMAFAFVDRWFHLESEELLQVMCTLPTDLAAAPVELLEALTAAYDNRPAAALSLSSDQLAALTQAWVARPVPLPLQRLLRDVVHERLLALDARHLVLACRISVEGVSANISQHQMGQIGSLETDPVVWWRRWMDHALSNCRHVGWGRCREAMREVQEWRRSARLTGAPTAFAEQVLQEVIVHKLVESSDDVPLEFLLSVHGAADGMQVQERVADKLDFKIRQSLQEEQPTLSFAMAVAIGNGETPVQCSRGGVLWAAVVATIARGLRTHREVDFFCRCHPSLELYDAVAKQAKEDWCSLELQLRRPGPPLGPIVSTDS